jgi:subtilisin family serine protease
MKRALLFLVIFFWVGFAASVFAASEKPQVPQVETTTEKLAKEIGTRLLPGNESKDNHLAGFTAGKNLKNQKIAVHREGELLVKFKKGVKSIEALSLMPDAKDLSINKKFAVLSRLRGRDYALIRSNKFSASQLADKLKHHPNVEAVSFNYAKYLDATSPDDPDFSSQWPLNNSGQIFRSGQLPGTPDADIDAPEAWDLQTGSQSVVVAVVDTGVDYLHPDLISNMWVNQEEANGTAGIDDDGNGYVDDVYGVDTGQEDSDPMDIHGHGTHVAGTIAAEGDNNVGVAGINWDARIMAIKGFGSDIKLWTDAELAAYEYILEMKEQGVNIVAVNASYGSTWYDPFQKDGIESLADAGIIFVASAGNDGVDNDQHPHYPSDYDLDNIVSVVATDCNDALADFSDYGEVSTDLGAPGVQVLSTLPDIQYLPSPTDVFFDDMESGSSKWSAYGPWAITQEVGWPNYAWSDSPNGDYGTNVFHSLVSGPIDLAANSDPKGPFRLGFTSHHELEADKDFLEIHFYAPPRPSLWQRTTEKAVNGIYAWSDSPNGNYPNYANSWLVSPVIDISAADDGAILSFSHTGTLLNNDVLRILYSADDGATWTWYTTLSGDYSDGWYGWAPDIPAEFRTSQFKFAFVLDTSKLYWADGYYIDDIAVQDSTHTLTYGNPFFHDDAEGDTIAWTQPQMPDWEYLGYITGSSDGSWLYYYVGIDDWFIWNQFRIAFVLNSDDVNQADGVYLDNIGIGIPTLANHTYGYWNGTSMAAPHVTGAVALLAAHHPDESLSGRVYRILDGVDPLSALLGMTTTGGRLNLFNSLTLPGLCECDLDGGTDNDVDGSDLTMYISNSMGIGLAVFAADFGRSNCP